MAKRILFLMEDSLLLLIGWVLLWCMQATVFINHAIYRAQEYTFKLHNVLRNGVYRVKNN